MGRSLLTGASRSCRWTAGIGKVLSLVSGRSQLGAVPRERAGKPDMREHDREGQAADVTEVTLDPFQVGAFWIGVAVVVTMADRPWTTPGTLSQVSSPTHRSHALRLIRSWTASIATQPSSRARVVVPVTVIDKVCFVIAIFAGRANRVRLGHCSARPHHFAKRPILISRCHNASGSADQPGHVPIAIVGHEVMHCCNAIPNFQQPVLAHASPNVSKKRCRSASSLKMGSRRSPRFMMW